MLKSSQKNHQIFYMFCYFVCVLHVGVASWNLCNQGNHFRLPQHYLCLQENGRLAIYSSMYVSIVCVYQKVTSRFQLLSNTLLLIVTLAITCSLYFIIPLPGLGLFWMSVTVSVIQTVSHLMCVTFLLVSVIQTVSHLMCVTFLRKFVVQHQTGMHCFL